MIILVLATAWAGDLQSGKALYARNCLACHGSKGDGRGPAAREMQPAPPDFTDRSWWVGKRDAALKTQIRQGKPSSAMMPFPKLSSDDVDHLIAYLRSLSS